MTDWPEGEIRVLMVDSIGERYRRYRLPDAAAEVRGVVDLIAAVGRPAGWTGADGELVAAPRAC
jgi:hypothetical protein